MTAAAPIGESPSLKLILVEDNSDDAKLIVARLRADGLAFTCRRADTEASFVAALDDGADLILCDHTLPNFGAARALDIVHERGHLIPFLIVSGTISEDLAVDFMRRGATDYLLKGHLERLGPAVRNALERHVLIRDAWAKQIAAGGAEQPLQPDQRLHRDEELFSQLFDGHPDAVWLCDASTLRFLQANPMAIKRYQYSRQEFLGLTLHDLLASGEGLPAGGRSGGRHRLRDGTEIDVETSANTVEWFGSRALLLVSQDVTERRASERNLWNRVLHDPLTSLANRTLLLDRINQSLSRQRRAGPPPALILLDLDRFKAVNDSAGHAVGDLALQEVARRIQSLVRSGDTACRLGGDEFVVLLDNPAGIRGATELAGRIMQRLAAPITVAGETFVIGCSIGIAVAEPDCRGPEELLRNADLAMYSAKKAGGGAVRLFHQPDTGTPETVTRSRRSPRRA